MATFHNKTRTSPSIPIKLWKQGKGYLVPLYYLLSLSDLAREGFHFSGSYRFADHIYESIPKGKYGLGVVIDFILLSLPSARSFKNRYIHTRDEVVKHILRFQKEKEIHVLSIPSGIPRTLLEAADILQRKHPQLHKKTIFHCLDLDRDLIMQQKNLFEKSGSRHVFQFHVGDALEKESYPVHAHIIVSTGLGEFLERTNLIAFYNTCHAVLQKDGVFITSASTLHQLSDYLMRNIGELYAFYRTQEEIQQIFKETPFRKIHTYKDSHGYQTIIIGQK